MRILSIIFCTLMFFALQEGKAYGLNWIALHDTAYRLSIEPAAEKPAQVGGDDVNSLYLQGLLNLYRRDDTAAQTAFEKVLKLAPAAYEAQWGLCEILRRRHRLDESAVLLDGIIKDHPDFAPAFITLGFIHYTRGDYAGCAALGERLLDQAPAAMDRHNRVRAHLMLTAAYGMMAHDGGLLGRLRYGPLVTSHLRAAEKIMPDDAGVLFGRGTFYLFAPPLLGHNLSKAEDRLLRARLKDPLFVDIDVRLAQVYQAMGKNELYAQYMAQARAQDPQNELYLDISSGTCRFICIK